MTGAFYDEKATLIRKKRMESMKTSELKKIKKVGSKDKPFDWVIEG